MNVKNMRVEDRLIVALGGTRNTDEIRAIVEPLNEAGVKWFKVGLELISAIGAICAVRFLQEDMGVKVFLDGKFYDTPDTVGAAVSAIAEYVSPEMLDVPMAAGYDAVRAAVRNKRGGRVIVNTVLTSQSAEELYNAYVSPWSYVGSLEQYPMYDPDELYLYKLLRHMAYLAKLIGANGITCPASCLGALQHHREFDDMLIISPGVRFENSPLDNHLRPVTPQEAIECGADILVVGRPVTSAHSNDDALPQSPQEAAEWMFDGIKTGLRARKAAA